MLPAKLRIGVIRQDPAQQAQLDFPGAAGRLQDFPVPPALFQAEAQAQQGVVCGAQPTAQSPADGRRPSRGQGSNSRTKGLRICTKNPLG